MLFRYGGGKGKIADGLARTIRRYYTHGPSQSPEFREVFLGSGAVTFELFRGTPTDRLWINDYDPAIAAIWNSVHHHRDELIDRIRTYTPVSEDFYRMKELLTSGTQDDISTLDLGFLKLVIHQISYSGLGVLAGAPIGGKNQTNTDGSPKKYQVGCRWSPKQLIQSIRYTGTILDKVTLRHDICTSLDFSEVIRDTENPAFLYLDPPYYIVGNQLYQFGMTENDHVRLASELRNTEHPWLLSYDDCSQVRDLYDWAQLRTIDMTYSIVTRGGKSTRKQELLICRKEDAKILFP